jgi:hypothetical protein
MWKPIAEAPFGLALELAVIDAGEAHPVMFACRLTLNGWVKAETGAWVDVCPTHWREWYEPD